MLIDLIPTTTNVVDEKLIDKWNSLKPLLESKYILKTNTIDGSLAIKYKHDFEGLLIEHGIEPEYFYPHMLVNDILSSRDYDGSIFNLIILQTDKLSYYLELFKN